MERDMNTVSMEEKLRAKLREEAEEWIERELKERMEYAEAEILKQANVALEVVGAEKAQKHIVDAIAYAEQEIRVELDNQSRIWIEEEMKKRLKKDEKP